MEPKVARWLVTALGYARVDIGGYGIDALRLGDVLSLVERSLRENVGGWVFTPNVDILRRASRDAQYRETVEGATVRVADGMPLVWASRVSGQAVPERVAGSDMFMPVCGVAARTGSSVLLIGPSDEVLTSVALRLNQRHPSLKLVDPICPPVGFLRDEDYIRQLRDEIERSRPDVVIVGLGVPVQDQLIALLRHDLPDSWFFGFGAAMAFAAGFSRRAPQWMRRTGIEWVHRLRSEPTRLWRRYLIHDMPFGAALMTRAALLRLRSRGKVQR